MGIEYYFGIAIKDSLDGIVVERSEKKEKKRKEKEREKKGRLSKKGTVKVKRVFALILSLRPTSDTEQMHVDKVWIKAKQ